MAQVLTKHINREKLLNQGVSMLMTKGYHGTGLKEILDAVQIPKGSFYNYFGSKEAFCAEVINHYIEPFILQLQNHLETPDVDGLTALKNYFNEMIVELKNNQFKGGCLLGNLMGELGDNSEICQKALQKAVQRYSDLLSEGLLKAQREGFVRTDLSAQLMADLLVNTWQGVLLRMKIEKSVAPLESGCNSLLDGYFKS
ncbi:MAG: TetR family transcriptional regulator C-terminal domain-containing protein [Methylococcaceae bacterium]